MSCLSKPDPASAPSAVPQAVFREPLQDLQAEEGSTAVLRCELATSATVVWNKGGLEVLADTRREQRLQGCTAELVLRDLRREDAGEYTCVCGSQATSATLAVTGGSVGRWTVCNFCWGICLGRAAALPFCSCMESISITFLGSPAWLIHAFPPSFVPCLRSTTALVSYCLLQLHLCGSCESYRPRRWTRGPRHTCAVN